MKVLTTAAPGTHEWLAARAGKIGSTAAVNILLGADRNHRTFGTPLTEWARLTGRAAKDALADADDEMRKILAWGQKSEPLHRQLLADETGGTFEGPPGVIQHDSIDWLAVSPDGYCTLPPALLRLYAIALPDGTRGSIELKAPTRFTVHEWDEGVPLTYQVQSATIMAVEKTPFCLGSALIPPSTRWAIVPHDAIFEQYLLDTLGHFMDFHVAKDIPPDATFRPIDKAILLRLHPRDNGLTVDLPEEIEAEFASLRVEQETAKGLEKTIEGRKARIVQAIGPNTEGRVGPFSATYKHQTRTVSCKACGVVSSQAEFRVFRPKFA